MKNDLLFFGERTTMTDLHPIHPLHLTPFKKSYLYIKKY